MEFNRMFRSPNRSRGVSLVEFAIIFPIALVLVLGIVQIGLIYIGKINLNHATFMAARRGAVENGTKASIRGSLQSGLIPFYQNVTDGNVGTRLIAAKTKAVADSLFFLQVERLSPAVSAMNDFGVTVGGKKQIPNDNLAFRNSAVGGSSGASIQDANLLKIKVTYGYELKVPLMAKVLRTVMCGTNFGVPAIFGSPGLPVLSSNCLKYYSFGRIPMVSYAIVQMQSPVYSFE